METLLIVVLCLLAFLSLVNFFILVYLAAFLVRLRGFVSDVLNLIVEGELTEPVQNMDVNPTPVAPPKPKTWDQKYEEELDMIERMRRQERGDSGLVDLE